MDIFHKYCHTNFEQLNIDFLLESVADHSNKITQLRTDLTAEINTRIADVEALTAEDEALTAFANAIQADLNQEISDRAAAVAAEATAREAAVNAEAAAREAADDAISDLFRADINELIGDINTINSTLSAEEIQLFHLSYGQGGVLDCTEDEAPYISRAFDTGRRCMVQFVDGTWYERINLVDRTTVQEAYFAKLSANSATWVSGGIIKLTHVVADDTHTFTSSGFSVDTAPIVIHVTSSSNVPDVSATFTTSDDLWDVEFMDKNIYIELTCPGVTPTRFYTRTKSVIYESLPGSYSAEYVFSYWDLDIRYDIDIVLSKTDVTDPTTWTTTMTGRKKTYETVS